ncbi:MAG: efflux transporter outer membrane subunit [Methylibium sp.]|nr:efflux transporter outer membrane subunit [Methylibium sp.]
MKPSIAANTNRRLPRSILAPVFAALLLAGCVTAPAIDPAALPVAPAAFKERDNRWTLAAPAEPQARGQWWQAFADPTLTDLVERAGLANNTIHVATARLAQARALLRATDANRAPQIGIGASASRGTQADTGSAATTFLGAGADLGYELDLFGRLATASRAAALDAQAREALLQSTRLLVQADVARTYLALRAVDEERALVRETVAAYRDTLGLTERRYQAGDIAELDVARIRTEVAATESEALALDRQRAELEHALAVLVGEAASGFEIDATDWATALPVIPPGVPSTLLARRPDVSAAQSSMLAAQARVGVAQAAWFPNLSLTASGGYASPELGDLFRWSARAWGIGALLSLPLFDGGRREAGVQNASAELDAALAGYREQVLVAFRDVEDQLSALRLLSQQAEAQSRAVAAANRATLLSNSRWRNGYVSQLELLDAQRSELFNRRQALQVRSARYQATVGLVRALGGGWEGASLNSVERISTYANL